MKTEIYKCEPKYWLWLPIRIRIFLGIAYATIFSLSFLSVPFTVLFCFPLMWRWFPTLSTIYITLLVISCCLPQREWILARKFGQLLFEVFDFRCSISPDQRALRIEQGKTRQYIIAMHPHGIVPIHALLVPFHYLLPYQYAYP